MLHWKSVEGLCTLYAYLGNVCVHILCGRYIHVYRYKLIDDHEAAD